MDGIEESDQCQTEVPVHLLEKYPETSWIVQPCETYYENYKNCKKFKSKFHQYYTNGKTSNCKDERAEHKQCMEFRQTRSEESLKKMTDLLLKRREERLRNNLANDVWKTRDHPPDDWAAPIPDHIKFRKHASVFKEHNDTMASDSGKKESAANKCAIM